MYLLNKQRAGVEEFVVDFVKIEYLGKKAGTKTFIDKERGKIYYIFDRVVSFSGHQSELFAYESVDWSIDHIYPQRPKGNPILSEDLLHNIGNLWVLEVSLNKSLGNSMPSEKCEQAIAQQPSCKQQLLLSPKDYDTWNEQVIPARADKLARHAYDKVFAIKNEGSAP